MDVTGIRQVDRSTVQTISARSGTVSVSASLAEYTAQHIRASTTKTSGPDMEAESAAPEASIHCSMLQGHSRHFYRS